MRHTFLFSGIVLVGSMAMAQWQVPQQEDRRVEPIYPRNDPYNFQSGSSNYDPFQFNWHSGRWDYVPIPYDTQGPYRLNWSSGQWSYVPWQAPSVQNVPPQESGGTIQPNLAPPGLGSASLTVQPMTSYPLMRRPTTRSDDGALWSRPTSRPTTAPAAREVQFEGKLTGVRAIDLHGERTPHLLIRLLSDKGAKATVDVDDRLDLDELQLEPGSNKTVAVHGALGQIDGSPVIFADQIKVGAKTVNLDRDHSE